VLENRRRQNGGWISGEPTNPIYSTIYAFPKKERESAGIPVRKPGQSLINQDRFSREKTGTPRDTPEKFFYSANFRHELKL
jgi:hypothetical protein